MIKSRLKNFFVFLIILFFTHIVFNFGIWQEVFSNQASNLQVSDATITEFIAETGYQKLKTGQNPFSYTDKLFYPFGANYSMNDPGITNSLFFIVLRPFLSIHQSTLLIVMSNLILTGILMYWLLHKLFRSYFTSGLFALVFTFMPNVSQRLMGHFAYTATYFFPAIGLILLYFLENTSVKIKVFLSLLFSFLLSMMLYSNFYYFIMTGLSLGFFFYWQLIKGPKVLLNFVLKNYKFLFLAGITFLIILIPWLIEVKNYLTFESRFRGKTIGSAVHYSADLLSFLVPNNYNPFYSKIFGLLSPHIPYGEKFYDFFDKGQERLTYPGFLLLGTFICFALNYKRIKKTETWSKLQPLFVISLFFTVLTLGPFLKVLGKWGLNFNGAQIVFPLPFLFFSSLPILDSLRVPTRFMPILTFFACILATYVMSIFLQNKSQSFKKIFISLSFLIFFVDQFYVLPAKKFEPMPLGIYQEIKKDQSNYRVLEIPFTVRDGFGYLGFIHALSPMQGSLIHNKPIMGGYFARVSSEVFEFYYNLNFLGYVAKITDKGNYDPYLEQPKEPEIIEYTLDKKSLEDELDFFGIKYIILKNNEKYSAVINRLLQTVAEKVIVDDSNYWLLKRAVNLNKDFSKVDFTQKVEPYYIGRGLGIGSASYLMTDGKAIVFLKPRQNGKQKLNITAKAHSEVALKIYADHQYLSETGLTKTSKTYSFPLGKVKNDEIVSVMLEIVGNKFFDPKISFYEMSIN